MIKNLIDALNGWLCRMGMDAARAEEWDQTVLFALVIVMAVAAGLVCRYFILEGIARLVKKTKATWDDVVFDRKVMIHLSRVVTPVIIYLFVPWVFYENELMVIDVLSRLCLIYVVYASLRFVISFLAALYHVYSEQERYRNRPLKGLLQTAQVVCILVAAIIVVSILIGKDPTRLLTGLGASAAVLLLVFKDSIMGVVSGIQLAANDMLKVGDWIMMPKHNANGTVIEVTLNTVKVRNWDNTVVTIPPYLLVSDSFQNWQGMRESGGRRVARSVNIDMTTVRFCTPGMLRDFAGLELIREDMEQALAEGRELVNLGVFRTYLLRYLESLPHVNRELTYMIRQLQPTDKGIPIEVYFFSSVKDWVPYEAIQSDVFDHVLAVIPRFGLKVFQSPTGEDLRRLSALTPGSRTC